MLASGVTFPPPAREGMIIVPSPLGRRCPEGADEGDFDVKQRPNRALLIFIRVRIRRFDLTKKGGSLPLSNVSVNGIDYASGITVIIQQAPSGPSNAQSLPFSSTIRVLVFIVSLLLFCVVYAAGNDAVTPSAENPYISAKLSGKLIIKTRFYIILIYFVNGIKRFYKNIHGNLMIRGGYISMVHQACFPYHFFIGSPIDNRFHSAGPLDNKLNSVHLF